MPKKPNRYQSIIERVFCQHYRSGMREVAFDRDELVGAAAELNMQLPKNVGDIIYSLRYRTAMPEAILRTADEGNTWIIRPAGRGKYCFVQVEAFDIQPNTKLAETKVPDATPGLIEMYALGDEQAVLAKLRYNRLIDTFTGVTCYSLQNHLRTTVPDMGQVETDEVYVGVDRRGAHYVFPVQAKGAGETIGLVQLEQDVALCEAKFPGLIARPIAAQLMQDNLIALFEFADTDKGIRILAEKHYRLVPPDLLTEEELRAYRDRPE